MMSGQATTTLWSTIMKRLNKILIAGTLCFSLGYIGNDVRGELGVELIGTSFAFSPFHDGMEGHRPSGVLEGETDGWVKAAKIAPKGYCKLLRKMSDDLRHFERSLKEITTSNKGTLDYAEWYARLDAIEELRALNLKYYSRVDLAERSGNCGR